jgi:hypothetical protein
MKEMCPGCDEYEKPDEWIALDAQLAEAEAANHALVVDLAMTQVRLAEAEALIRKICGLTIYGVDRANTKTLQTIVGWADDYVHSTADSAEACRHEWKNGGASPSFPWLICEKCGFTPAVTVNEVTK